MDIGYYMKIQNAYGTKSRREKDLNKVNHNMSKHFTDTFDTETVLLNGKPFELMIVKDSDGNVFKKKIKARHGEMFNLGDYVEWNGQHWLITLVDHDGKTWNRGYMYFCPLLLRWQNKYGEIIERWGYSEDFTKYSSGVHGNKTIVTGDYQYGITLPVDDETKYLKRDRRFAIDLDGVEPPDVYKLTNRKILLTDATSYQRGGVITLTLSFDIFDGTKDKKMKLSDGKEVWICDYVDSDTEHDQVSQKPEWKMKLYTQNYSIRANGIKKEITAKLLNENDMPEKGAIYDWEVASEALQFIHYEVDDNKLSLFVDSDCDMFGEAVKISCTSKDTGHSATISLTIQEVF